MAVSCCTFTTFKVKNLNKANFLFFTYLISKWNLDTKWCPRPQKPSDQPCICSRVCVIRVMRVHVSRVRASSESVSQSSQLLFLFISLANICCRCAFDVFSIECLDRGLPGIGRVPACRRRDDAAVAAVMWAGLLSAERLLWMKLLPPWGYCSVSRVEEENT